MKTNSMRSMLRFLFDTARQYADGVVRYTVFTALAALGILCTEWLILPILLHGLEAAWSVTTLLWVIGGFVVLLSLLYTAQRYTEGAFSECRDRFRTRGSTALVRKALTMSYSHTTDTEKRHRLHRAAEAMGRHIHAPIPRVWHTLSQTAFHAVAATVFAVVLLRWDPLVTLVTAAAAVLGAVVHRAVSRLGERERDKEAAQDEASLYISHVAESPSFSKDIRVFGLQDWLRELYDRTVCVTEAILRRRGRVYFLYNAADAALTLLRNAAAYTALVQAVFAGAVSTPLAVLYFTAISGFTASVGGVLRDGWSLRRSLDALALYRDVMDEKEHFLTDGGMLPQRGVPHTLELCAVSVATARDGSLLSNVSLTLHAGESLAVVGEDHNGKQALVRLLCGLQDPTSGTVRLDGTDIRALDRRAYYALLSTVLSGGTVPAVTVAELVSASSDTMDDARVQSCIEAVGLADMIRSLPKGTDTHLGREAFEDGVELSGGQHQRLVLARAMYKNGDIWILDEPQAKLDPLAEHRFYTEFIRLSHGKTAVLFSNRLAAARLCDRIVYVKHGAITEEGTHEELLSKGGDYARLFRLQCRYYHEGRDPDVEVIGE